MVDTVGMGNCVICIFFCILTVVTLPFIIALFIFSVENWDASCDDSGFMPLGEWLVPYGVVVFLFPLCNFIGYFIFDGPRPCGLCGSWFDENYTPCALITSAIFLIFTIVWSIIGGILLFKYDGSCRTYSQSLWIMTLVTLIIEWIISLVILGGGGYLLVRYIADKQEKKNRERNI